MGDDAPRMGERDHHRDQPHDQPETGRRVTVRDAADELGITVEAVRNRIKRGTLASEKQEGTVFVLLDGERVHTDQPTAGRDQPRGRPTDGHDRTRDQPRPDDQPAELVEELRDRIAYLERQVEEEREARRRADTLMARLMDRVPEIEPPGSPDPPGARESAMASETRADTPTASASPQKGVQRRSWWQRLLGT